MKSYLDIVNKVFEEGSWKKNRTGIDALSINCEVFRHNMDDGFPLLTTKKVAFRAMCVELEGFIKGINSKKWYADRGCNFWKYWANPYKTTKNQIDEDDLGAIYGVQWRRFNQAQDRDDGGWVEDYHGRADQLQTLIENLKYDPFDRRLIVSAWNPLQLDRMALPPCHCFFHCVYNSKGTLDLNMYQRSCDLMLGVPINIASYALLLILICKETNYKPGILNIILGDCHIYRNHLKKAEEQSRRSTKRLPSVVIKNWKDIYSWTYKDIKLENYNPHSKIDFGAVAV